VKTLNIKSHVSSFVLRTGLLYFFQAHCHESVCIDIAKRQNIKIKRERDLKIESIDADNDER
jgi:hypothetical protein